MTEATSAAAVDETAAASAGEVDTVEFKGESFELNDSLSEYAVLEFADAVDSGLDGGSYAAMAAVLRFVLELIAEKDRARFRTVARRNRVTVDDLFALLKGDVEEKADRPTGLPGDSSPGQQSTPEKSVVSFAGKAYPLAGRPDLLIAVEDAVRAA